MATKASGSDMKDKKGIRTRELITRAARKVFSEHPYHAASMRMIGKEAGIEHPLINYYFPSKARLFETITHDICDEFLARTEEWLTEVREAKTPDGFLIYINRLLEFNSDNPEPIRLLALNMTQAEHITQIPGYQQFPDLIEKIQQLFMKIIPNRGTKQAVGMFINSFTFQVISLLGSSPCVAQVQGMEPGSAEFKDWVRNTLVYIYLPHLRNLINPTARTDPSQKKKTAK
jgi:TetR/AcrR family transcriptional regulator